MSMSNIFAKADLARQMIGWAVELSEFKIQYQSREGNEVPKFGYFTTD